ncbi:MAG: DinB family protein [Vicinamibacterales bacterium]
MSPQEARIITNFLIADFEHEIQTTDAVLGAVPAGHVDYRPDPKSKTGLGLVRHLALEDAWLLNCIADGVFTPPPDDSDTCGIASPADARARYGADVPAALARVRALPDEALTRTIDMFGMFQAPAVVFLAMAIKHSVHHRGQLSSYLRAMGGQVPGIYGPSGDTRQAV